MTELKSTIRNYNRASLSESICPNDPITLFETWLEEALKTEQFEPNAMTLATVDQSGHPTARIVLLKDVSAAGFTFFTNYHSTKAAAIAANPFAALVFWWPVTERQVRIEGSVTKTSATTSSDYFQCRSKEAKLGAHASDQSHKLASRAVLDQRFAQLQAEYANTEEIPRPEHWGGYLVTPTKIEFWQGGLHRLHDRICYTKQNDLWSFCRLAP